MRPSPYKYPCVISYGQRLQFVLAGTSPVSPVVAAGLAGRVAGRRRSRSPVSPVVAGRVAGVAGVVAGRRRCRRRSSPVVAGRPALVPSVKFFTLLEICPTAFNFCEIFRRGSPPACQCEMSTQRHETAHLTLE